MDWIIKSKDEITGRIGENRYQTEAGFRAALSGIFGDTKQRFISATLPDGTALDEAAARVPSGFVIGRGAIGIDSI